MTKPTPWKPGYQCLYDLEGIAAVAYSLWQAIEDRPGLVIACQGPLGAGKTTLLRHLLEQAGYDQPVTSPTYALWHEYPWAAGVMHHVDAYRLRDGRDMFHLGIDDAMRGRAWCWCEWPNHVISWLEQYDKLILRLDDHGEHARCLTVLSNLSELPPCEY